MVGFPSGFGEFGAGGTHQGREVVAVVDILDVEVGLCAVVGRTQVLAAEQLAARLGGFQVEAVVADEAENITVSVDTIVSEHFLRLNLSRPTALVGDILYKIRIACHVKVSD